MMYSALLGSPVDHSVSPALFAALAREAGIEYAHIKINTETVDALRENLHYLDALGFVGCNITLPYKGAAVAMMDRLHDGADTIAAVNTVLFEEGRYIGYNTDAMGAISAITSILGPIMPASRAVIIGAGGASRAIIYELHKRGVRIDLLNRTYIRAVELAEAYGDGGIQAHLLNRGNLIHCIHDADYVINATPVGMFPLIDESLVPDDIYETISIRGKKFFDVILNPCKTSFLRDAEKHGALICSGLYMMIHQATAAIFIWTGIDLQGVDASLLYEDLRKYCV